VLEYSPAGALLSTFTGGTGSGALKGPTGLAIDAAGNLWVADRGDDRVEELSPTGAPIAEIKSAGVESVALDGRGDVLAIVTNSEDFCGSIAPPCSHLVEYDAAGVRVGDVGAGVFRPDEGTFLGRLPMAVSVDESSDRAYVTDTGKELIWIFGPPTAPTVGKEFTAEVGASEAKLGALINPGGIETTYRFDYGITNAYGQSAPMPDGSVGEGLSPRAVWAAANGLEPGTSYHYRVVATNELGTTYGPDQTFTTATAEQAMCPNEQLRDGFSARLADCRAYELVSAPTATSVQVRGGGAAALDGGAISFSTHEPLPGAPTGGDYYLATRASDGWRAEDVIPLESHSGTTCNSVSNEAVAYSDQLAKTIVSFGFDTRASEPGGSTLERQECNTQGVQVVPGEPVGYQNLLLRDNESGGYRLINAPEPGLSPVPADAHFRAAAKDLGHVIFSEQAPLTSNAPAGAEDLYEWDEGVVRLVTVLPSGAPVVGSLAEAPAGANPVSGESSHVLFVSKGDLYVRIGAQRTIQVDESQEGPDPSGAGSFQAASASGSKVLFLDERRLTRDATAAPGEPDLYECALPEGASRCQLTDLTVAKAGGRADVLRVSVLGSKDDLHVYFLAKAVLASNTREYVDAQGKAVTEAAQSGGLNLYLWDGNAMTFIAGLDESDFGAGQASPDGKWFAFASAKSLTGYDNVPAGTGGSPRDEIFIYSSDSNQLACASCNPSGEAPLAGVGGASLASSSRYMRPRVLADGGRMFFDTREALVPSDTNAQTDVYEYEEGQPHLVSGGVSPEESTFIDASESGDDAFFLSRQQLVPQDTEQEAHVIYDARVGGGFPAVSPAPPCSSPDACRAPGAAQPAIFGPPSSQTFSGVGNLVRAHKTAHKRQSKKRKRRRCKKGFAKRKGRCLRRKAGSRVRAGDRGRRR
jgi:hypothetical protein